MLNGATATFTDTVGSSDLPKYTAQFLDDGGLKDTYDLSEEIFNTSTAFFTRGATGSLSITKYTL